MAKANFDYGADPISTGKVFQNPTVGKHVARIRSIIHLGMFQEEFKGKLKDPAPEVAVIFELKDEEDISDTGEPLEAYKVFPLKKGDKAFLTTFEKAVDAKGELSSFDEFIGRAVELDLVGSKELDDKGLPKYVNFGSISALHPKLAATADELTVKGVGHVRFPELTKEAIMELHPLLHVADVLIHERNSSYKGSKAEAIIAEIRKDNKEFATRKESDKPAKEAATPTPNKAPAEKPEATPPAELAEDEEF